jgi:hypothetical protein
MTTQEDQFADTCMEIVNQIDVKLQETGNEETLESWKEGDWDACEERLKELFPDVKDEQWDWIEDFISEI